jgi:hypothetical protein
MKRQLLLILFLIITYTQQIYAQNISGEVKGPQGKSLAGATVILQNLSDTIISQSSIVNENGSFVFKGISKGKYLLDVSHIGFRAFQINNILVDGISPTIRLPLIVLQPAVGQTLKEVVITAKKPLIEQQIDRTVVNVDAMISATSSNALQILGKSPGVMIDANDNISMNGQNNVMILIDDRPTYLSGPSLASYLRSLPGGMLDKLELLSNPPARYDANGGAVINIMLKKKQAPGFNGTLNVGYNQGVYARSNNAINVNYRTPKFNMFGNIGYSRDHNFSDQTFSRYFFNNDGGPNKSILQNSGSVYKSESWNGRIGIDYFVSPKTTLGIILTGSTRPRTDNLNYTTMQYNNAVQLDSIGHGLTSGKYSSRNIGVNLNLQHKFAKTGELFSVNIDQLNYSSGSNQFSPLDIYRPDGSIVNHQQRIFTTPSIIHIYAAKADYSLPLARQAEFTAGLKSSYVSTNNQNNWLNGQAGTFIPDYERSNHFRYSENTNSGYINFKKNWKYWAIQGGLRVENTNASGQQFANPATQDSIFNKHYTSLFPSFYLLRRLDSTGNHTLTLSLNRRVNRPSYQQLNPFLFFKDQYSYNGGNPNLVPSFAIYPQLKYSYKQYFGLTVSYGGGDKDITQLTQTYGPLLITRPVNFLNNRRLAIIPYASVNPTNWWTLNLQAVILFQTSKGKADGVNLDQHTNVHEIETDSQFKLSKTWSAELNGFFPGAQTYAQTSNNSVYNISAAIQKKLWKDQATIGINVNDLFHTLPLKSQTLGINDVSAFNTRNTDSRYLGVSFTYRFGKAINARKRNDSSSAEEEKGRTN